MSLKDFFIIGRGTRVVLTITLSVTVIAVVFALLYYRSVNRSEDPRIAEARDFISEYDRVSGRINSYSFFFLLDSADNIFRSLPDYKNSFETGVIFNNRCSGMLLMALYDTTVAEREKSTLLDLSMNYCDSAISVYNSWMREWGGLSEGEISSRLTEFMSSEDDAFNGRNFNNILRRRIKNIETAQLETPRRLSVSYSNKATIFRHYLKPDSAMVYYRKALSAWGDNRTARSNLSVLMGGDPIKPKLIESLFPPDRNKE